MINKLIESKKRYFMAFLLIIITFYNVFDMTLFSVNFFVSAVTNTPFYVEVSPSLIILAPSNSTNAEIYAWDVSWSPINLVGHSIIFKSDYPQIVSVSNLGVVTALYSLIPGYDSIGIYGSVDGVMGYNYIHVVVLNKESLDKVGGIKTFKGEHTAICVPIKGYNGKIADYYEDVECAKVNDAAYEILHELFGTIPYKGARNWIIELPIDGNPPGYAGHSGNPIVVPYDLNSYNVLVNNDPIWHLFWHELGHNFLSSSDFKEYESLVGGNVNTAYIAEAFVILGAIYTQGRITSAGGEYNLVDSSISSVSNGFSERLLFAAGYLRDWKNTWSDLSTMNNPTSAGWMLTGKFLEIGDKYGWEIFPNFFELLNKAGQKIDRNRIPLSTLEGKNAVILALLSNAANQDLRGEFKDVNFPIDIQLFREFLDILTTIPHYPLIDDGTVSKMRCNIGSTQTVKMHLKWSDAGTDAVGLKMVINGSEYVTNSTGWVTIQEKYDTPVKKIYEVASIQNYLNYEIKIDQLSCVWDRVKIIEVGATQKTVKANEPSTIWYKAVYEYDNEVFDGSKGSLYVNDQSLIWSSTNQRWEKEFTFTQPSSTSFKVTGMQENKYGLTTLNDVTSPITVEWTQAGIPSYPVEAIISGLILFLVYALHTRLKNQLDEHNEANKRVGFCYVC
jgi:hypothetical protein